MARESLSGEITQLKREINDLNTLLNKLVATNINVHSKVTESLIKMDDLVKEVKDMVELLQVATEMESGPSEIKGLNEMVETNKKLVTNIVSIDTHLKKIYRRLIVISQAASIKQQAVHNRNFLTPSKPLAISKPVLPNPPLEKDNLK